MFDLMVKKSVKNQTQTYPATQAPIKGSNKVVPMQV